MAVKDGCLSRIGDSSVWWARSRRCPHRGPRARTRIPGSTNAPGRPARADGRRTAHLVRHHEQRLSDPPRRRPRSAGSISLHMTSALPMQRQWAAAGHTSLREITREHVLDTIPVIGAERAHAIAGLKSIFRLLKQRKVLFLDPTTRITLGNIPATQPLPLDPAHIAHVRDLLDSDSPAAALTVALIAFHGIRLGHLQRLKLTDIVDGRISVEGRTFPLAAPVRDRLAAWLDYRAQRWPETTNDTCSSTNAASTVAARSAPMVPTRHRLRPHPTQLRRTGSCPRPTPTAATSAPSPTSSASASAPPAATPTLSNPRTSRRVGQPATRPRLRLTARPEFAEARPSES